MVLPSENCLQFMQDKLYLYAQNYICVIPNYLFPVPLSIIVPKDATTYKNSLWKPEVRTGMDVGRRLTGKKIYGCSTHRNKFFQSPQSCPHVKPKGAIFPKLLLEY